jgi:FKBP-type peptidyl-prolyl cis-trans isomerase SlyD
MSNPLSAAAGRVVSIHYTLTLDDGSTVDTSDGGAPFDYLHGASNIVPGLEEQIAGHVSGDSFDAHVPCEQGYGDYEEDAIHHAKRSDFPDDMELEEGMQLMTEAEDGTVLPCQITEITGDDITVDFNHPLAGETLHFTVEVLSIRPATTEEIEHGHPHGEGEHEHDGGCCG